MAHDDRSSGSFCATAVRRTPRFDGVRRDADGDGHAGVAVESGACRGSRSRRSTRKATRRYVATYGKPNVVTAPREGQPLDQEMIDRLKSLGYVR